jgi:hypothetical protein
MSDPLDDLRAALGLVEPSPAFEQKTLARIEHERGATAKRAWLFLIPMAAAAAVIVIVSFRSGGVGDHSALPEPSGGLGNQSALREPAIASNPSTAPTTIMPRPSRHVARARMAQVAWAIPENAHADQAIAVRRLMTLIRAGKADVPADRLVFDDSGPVPMLAPIELKPIVITPLPNGQGGGSER